jgi:hypothetical protein
MGWLCVALICIATAAFAIGLAADQCRRAMERFEWAIIAKARHELGRDIQSCAHWFSESDEAWIAIKVLGERLTQGYATDVDRWREEWRERLRSRATEKAS